MENCPCCRGLYLAVTSVTFGLTPFLTSDRYENLSIFLLHIKVKVMMQFVSI